MPFPASRSRPRASKFRSRASSTVPGSIPIQSNSARRFFVLRENAALSCPFPVISTCVPPGSAAANASTANPSASRRNAASTRRAVHWRDFTAPALRPMRRPAPGAAPASCRNRSRQPSNESRVVEKRASIVEPSRQSALIVPEKRWSPTTASTPVNSAPSGPSPTSASNVPSHPGAASPCAASCPEKTKPAVGSVAIAPTATASKPPLSNEIVAGIRSCHTPADAAIRNRRPSSAASASRR